MEGLDEPVRLAHTSGGARAQLGAGVDGIEQRRARRDAIEQVALRGCERSHHSDRTPYGAPGARGSAMTVSGVAAVAATLWRSRATRSTRHGVQSGVQIERNRAQISATETAVQHRIAPGTPRTLRLGAGRSQVQILSPRLRTRRPPEDSGGLRRQQEFPLLSRFRRRERCRSEKALNGRSGAGPHTDRTREHGQTAHGGRRP